MHSQEMALRYADTQDWKGNPDGLKDLIDWFADDAFAAGPQDLPQTGTFTQERQVNPPDTLTTTSPSSGREATPKQKGLVRARAVAAGLDEQRLNTILIAESGQSGLENLQFEAVDGVLQAIGR